MFFRLLTNIFCYDSDTFLLKTNLDNYSSSTDQIIRYMINIKNNEIITFSENSYNSIKNGNENNKFLVTNNPSIYLNERNTKKYLRFSPFYFSKIHRNSPIVNEGIEISKITYRTSDVSYIKDEDLKELYDDYNEVFIEIGHLAKCWKICAENLNKDKTNNIILKDVFFENERYFHINRLLLRSKYDDSYIWNFEIINSCPYFYIHWLKKDEDFNSFILFALKALEINIKDIELIKNSYYKLKIFSQKTLQLNYNNINLNYKIMNTLANDIFSECNNENDILNKIRSF